MPLLFFIAFKHLLDRKRQSIVSLLGIILGVAFFLTISSLMQGSQKDFIERLVDNLPHISITDEFREPRKQPLYKIYPNATIEIKSVKPVVEVRGIRNYREKLKYLKTIKGLKASPTLTDSALVNYSGKVFAINLSGIIPNEFNDISTIEKHMVEGGLNGLSQNRDGIIIGNRMAETLSVKMGDILSISADGGRNRVFKIVGIFSTGIESKDYRLAFIDLKKMQALLNRPNRINDITIKIENPYNAAPLAIKIEAQMGYKTLSWQEKSQDIIKMLTIRNIIMYTVVSAVLLVASFGIYNVISTVVMEKQKDISILKSMGFYARDIQKIFLIQGIVLGIFGSILGIPLGAILMRILEEVTFKPPGTTEAINMPMDWGILQFIIAIAFAIIAATTAALLPARKASNVEPVDILRGAS